MKLEHSRTVAFVNADIAGSGRGTLRIRGERILSVGERAQADDHVVDLRGDRLLPGLVNAHEHLHRNHLGRLRYRARHANATDWAEDIDARRSHDPRLLAAAAMPRGDALLVGGFKNLLAGATTVAHHDEWFAELADAAFPVRVLARYGWSHSLAIDGATQVRASHAATGAATPWFIHAAEGTDAAAMQEADRLAALGVLTPNAVLIHGVGFDTATRAGLVRRGVGLVWCPGSNYFLFGQTASVRDFARAGLLALGSDSRLTGARDLLDELRFARGHGVEDAELESLVTERAARLLQLPDRGVLRAGALADLLVLPRDARLWELRRADLLAVLVRGAFRWGDRDYARELLELRTHCSARIDGRPKVFDRPLAHALRASSMTEPGVEWSADPARAA